MGIRDAGDDYKERHRDRIPEAFEVLSEEVIMSTHKAFVGDFIRFKDRTSKVIRVLDEPNPLYTFYCMDDGRIINDHEITMENVLLESEVM